MSEHLPVNAELARRWMDQYEKSLNARASAEQTLFDVANGKREALTRDECRELALKLGVPALRETAAERARGVHP